MIWIMGLSLDVKEKKLCVANEIVQIDGLYCFWELPCWTLYLCLVCETHANSKGVFNKNLEFLVLAPHCLILFYSGIFINKPKLLLPVLLFLCFSFFPFLFLPFLGVVVCNEIFAGSSNYVCCFFFPKKLKNFDIFSINKCKSINI